MKNIFTYALFLFASSLHAQGMPMGARIFGFGPQNTTLQYEGGLFSKAPKETEHKVEISTPVYKSQISSFSASLTAGSYQLDERIQLDNQIIIPRRYYETEMTIGYSRRLLDQKAWSIQASVGSAGDKVDTSDQTYTLRTTYSFPTQKQGHWVLFLMIANNGPFGNGIPIPGFLYMRRLPNVTLLVGLPVFAIRWTPHKNWYLNFNAFGPQLSSELGFGPNEKRQYFLGARWDHRRFLLSDRTNKKDRLTIESKQIFLGFRDQFGKSKHSAELKIGQSMDRRIYLGDGLFNTDGGLKKLKPTQFLTWSFHFNF